jgi:hypothetical protein
MIGRHGIVADSAKKVVELFGHQVEGMPPAFDTRFADEPFGITAQAGGQAFGGQDDTTVGLYQLDGQAVGLCGQNGGRLVGFEGIPIDERIPDGKIII